MEPVRELIRGLQTAPARNAAMTDAAEAAALVLMAVLQDNVMLVLHLEIVVIQSSLVIGVQELLYVDLKIVAHNVEVQEDHYIVIGLRLV